MSPLPGLANVLGVGAALLYHALDPREQEQRILNARKNVLKEPNTPRRAERLLTLDGELQRVRAKIARRAS